MPISYSRQFPGVGTPDKRQIRWHPEMGKFLFREFCGKQLAKTGTCDRVDLPQHLADEAVSRAGSPEIFVAISYLDWPL